MYEFREIDFWGLGVQEARVREKGLAGVWERWKAVCSQGLALQAPRDVLGHRGFQIQTIRVQGLGFGV